MKKAKPMLWFSRGLWWCALSKSMPNPLFHQGRLAVGLHTTAEGAFLAWQRSA